jgi:MtN3 and saliva related transmembrane protein
MIEIIGWASSLILILTIATQIAKQWRDKTSAGVSTWLFVGQLGASVGFTIYSLLVKNWVFAVTNGIMILNGLIGYGITVRHKRARGTRHEVRGMR